MPLHEKVEASTVELATHIAITSYGVRGVRFGGSSY